MITSLTLNMDHKMAFTLISLGIRAIHLYPSSWSLNVRHTFLEALNNIHLSKGRSVVENAFGTLKKNQKTITQKQSSYFFIPNVVTCYCLLYNFILNGKDVDVDALML